MLDVEELRTTTSWEQGQGCHSQCRRPIYVESAESVGADSTVKSASTELPILRLPARSANGKVSELERLSR